MKRSFNYNFNRRTKIHTAITLLLVAIIAVVLYYLYTGGFFSAWFISVVLALVALMVLSIPRRVVLLDNRVEIQCI
jgi:small-conductance mechanosensitive channel